MSSPEEIEEQQRLLDIHRRTLAHYLEQQARLGLNHTSPGITNGIDETRKEIHRIKGILRDWNVKVIDHPNDTSPSPPQQRLEAEKPGYFPLSMIVIMPFANILLIVLIFILLKRE